VDFDLPDCVLVPEGLFEPVSFAVDDASLLLLLSLLSLLLLFPPPVFVAVGWLDVFAGSVLAGASEVALFWSGWH